MSDDPLSGREPSLSRGGSELSGDEPFLGGEGSLAALMADLAEIENVPSVVLVARLASVIPQLLPYLDGDDARLRSTAARMIGLVAARHPASRPETVPLLIRILNESSQRGDFPAATDAIERLGDTEDPRAASRLTEIFSNRDLVRLERPAVDALSRLGMIALPLLMEKVMVDGYHERSMASIALRQVCRAEPQAIPVVTDWLFPMLIEPRDETDSDVYAVFTEVGEFMTDRILGLAADQSRDIAHRKRALYLLRRVSDPRISPLMFDILNSDDRKLWHIAASVLTVVRVRADIPRILALLEDPRPEIRRLCIRVVGRRRIKASISHVLQTLSEPHAPLRCEAVKAAKRIRDTSAVEALLPLLMDPSRQVRRETISAIAAFAWRERDLRPRLVAALQEVARSDPDTKVREQAKSMTRYW